MTARSLRAVRGVTAAAIATVLAAVSHTLGGGSAPSAGLILAITLMAAPLATALVGPRLTLWRLTTAVLMSQIAFHAAFSTFGSEAGAGMVASAHQHGSSARALPSTDAIPPAPNAITAVFSADPLMVGVHVAAAIVSIALLHRGEHALRCLMAMVIDVVARRSSVPVSSHRPALPATASALAIPVSTPLTTSIRRRGPPTALLLP